MTNQPMSLRERMLWQAQNNEMIDQYFTDSGKLLIEGADTLAALELQLAEKETQRKMWADIADKLDKQFPAIREMLLRAPVHSGDNWLWCCQRYDLATGHATDCVMGRLRKAVGRGRLR